MSPCSKVSVKKSKLSIYAPSPMLSPARMAPKQLATSGTKLMRARGWAGITEPVDSGVEPGVRMGLGKQQQDDFYTDGDNLQRRQLEAELQAEEGSDRRAKREVRGC